MHVCLHLQHLTEPFPQKWMKNGKHVLVNSWLSVSLWIWSHFLLTLNKFSLIWTISSIELEYKHGMHCCSSITSYYESCSWCSYSVLYCIENWCFSVKSSFWFIRLWKKRIRMLENARLHLQHLAAAFLQTDLPQSLKNRKHVLVLGQAACGQSTSLIRLQNQCNFKPFEICTVM